MVDVMKIMANFFQKVPCMHCYTRCPQPCIKPPPTHATSRVSWTLTRKSGSVSGGVTAPFSWYTQGSVCAHQESVSPVLCKFWQLYGRVIWRPPLPPSLCHTQVCCRHQAIHYVPRAYSSYNWKFVPLTTFIRSPHPLPPAFGNHSNSTYRWNHTILSFSDWFISLT